MKIQKQLDDQVGKDWGRQIVPFDFYCWMSDFRRQRNMKEIFPPVMWVNRMIAPFLPGEVHLWEAEVVKQLQKLEVDEFMRNRGWD